MEELLSVFSRLSIYPYKRGSRSAKLLSSALSHKLGRLVRRIKPNGTYRPRKRSRVVGWGAYTTPHWNLPHTQMLNMPQQVELARNKIWTFERLQQRGIPIPDWTTDETIARKWWNNGDIVLCRLKLTASQGAGIHIAKMEYFPMRPAPLYVKYKQKKQEFRVHVFREKVIDVAAKKRSLDGVTNEYIRSHQNGWIFCRKEIQEPSDLRSSAINSVAALELDFGAVDIIWNELENKCYVLEINTAPGFEGSTVDKYTHEICKWLD